MAGEPFIPIFTDIADVFAAEYKRNSGVLQTIIEGVQYENRMMTQFLLDCGLYEEYEKWLAVEEAYGRV